MRVSAFVPVHPGQPKPGGPGGDPTGPVQVASKLRHAAAQITQAERALASGVSLEQARLRMLNVALAMKGAAEANGASGALDGIEGAALTRSVFDMFMASWLTGRAEYREDKTTAAGARQIASSGVHDAKLLVDYLQQRLTA